MIDPAGPLEYRLRSDNGAATGSRILTRAAASAWILEKRTTYPGWVWTAEYRLEGEDGWRTVVEAPR